MGITTRQPALPVNVGRAVPLPHGPRGPCHGRSPNGRVRPLFLWWTPQHWQDKLGPNYPHGANPLPAPGSLAPSGCNPTVRFGGASIVDRPSEGLYDPGLAGTLDNHIGLAQNAGITGFLVDWQGTGSRGQAPAASGYNFRLDRLVQRVDAYNARHGTGFRLALALDPFGNYGHPSAAIISDLHYFYFRYGRDPAFAYRYSPAPLVIFMDSRKFSVATVQAISAALRPALYLVGDETYSSWSRDAAFLDGTAYYWSSEDPWANPSAGSQLLSLARQVHAVGKSCLAPFAADFNTQLAGGSCVPRNGFQTLDKVWGVNRASRPDGWFGISWNEFVENTYLEPTVDYGSSYLSELKRLIATADGFSYRRGSVDFAGERRILTRTLLYVS